VTRVLERLIEERGRPDNLRSDNGPEFTSRRMLGWAEDWKVGLVHIQPGRPMQNGHVESFNGRLRDEWLNVEVFFSLADARRKLAIWLHDYNQHRPHSALADRTPSEFAAICSGGYDSDKTALENAARLPHIHRTAAAGSDLAYAPVSSHLIETIT
jgi:putative transposase